MANTADNVLVASTGRVLHAPTTTALPTDAATAIDAAFKELGYIGEEGVTESEPVSETKIKGWQRAAVVRKIRTEHDVTYSMELLERLNDEVISVITGGAGTPAAYEITGTMPGYEAFIIEAVDESTDGNDTVERIVIPNGQVTEKGDTKYAGTAGASIPITITAYPDANGVKAYHYTAEDVSW